MSWIITSLSLIAAVLLVVQGVSCLTRAGRPTYVTWFGALALFLVMLGAVLYVVLSSGALILSPEFGVAMVQGPLVRVALIFVLVGIAALAAIGWHTTRSGVGLPARLPWALGVGLIIGAVGATRLLPLNAGDPIEFRIYVYDLWWPPLMIWLTVCLFDSAFTILGLTSRQARAWLAITLVTGLALYALHRPEFADPSSKTLWQGIFLIALSVSISFGSWLALVRSPNFGEARLWLRITLILTPACLGVVTGLLPFRGSLPPLAMWPSFLWLGWVGWLMFVGLATAWQLHRGRGAYAFGWRASRPTLRQIVLLTALAVIAISMASPFYFAQIDRTVALAAFILGWILVTEAAAHGPLMALCYSILNREIRDPQSLFRLGWTAARARLSAMAGPLGAWVKELTSASSMPGAIVKTLAGIALLVALSEIPNAGRTIIQPFTTRILSPPSSVPNELGKSVSDRVLNTLGVLNRDLRPDVIRLLPPDTRAGARFKIVTASGNGNHVDAALGKSTDLEIGNVKIPLGLLAAPIQIPMRALLSVRVIDGNVQIGQEGYAVLASSTTGETWRMERKANATGDPVAALADQLAFGIVMSDARLRGAGMTQSWEAFEPFNAGLEEWRRFEAGRHYDALATAIILFLDATKKDPQFALAHYRLGVALQQDGQPAAAVTAFRESVKVSPTFIAGYVALASTLYDLEIYYRRIAAASDGPPPFLVENKNRRREEARLVWQQVLRFPADTVSLSDRAGTYNGLCRHAFEDISESTVPGSSRHYVAYFYCKRADALYSQLSRETRDEHGLRTEQALALSALGLTLESAASTEVALAAGDWHCLDDGIMNAKAGKKKEFRFWQSPYSQAALRYHEQARLLLPDDTPIRCTAAATAYGLGNGEPMRALASDAAGRLSVASRAAQSAKQQSGMKLAAGYYRLALKEYQEAITLDPTNIDALNGYGYTFWEWRVRWPRAEAPDGPDVEMARWAEMYARRAVSFAAGKLSPETDAMVRSTLGEILLGQARPEEAIEELEKAIKLSPKHPFYDELRWDLAQAYLCASSNDSAAALDKKARAHREKAVPHLIEITRNNEMREDKLFSLYPQYLDPGRSRFVCRRTSHVAIEARPDPSGPRYILRKVGYEPYPLCNWVGVLVDVYDLRNKSLNDLFLHVWGGGVDKWIKAGDQPRDDLFLTAKPQETREYYLAQLEDQDGKPVSEVSPIQTFANDTDGRCRRNQIELTFAQER